ncbi:hypothetical protein AXF42_Ash006234 [Apostasia shenzhenica]|uniref:Uncharacterized protein n=1 Tax=Apostasia shenzhenica TaxID=1088818 RepID=A0A2I0B0L5_9ASPA|nr:hypothetical protein AXF42_Ash006234 [Apostasia shenzhenica]
MGGSAGQRPDARVFREGDSSTLRHGYPSLTIDHIASTAKNTKSEAECYQQIEDRTGAEGGHDFFFSCASAKNGRANSEAGKCFFGSTLQP